MSLSVKVNQASVDSVIAAVNGIKNGYQKVLVSAINGTLGTVQTQATARIGNKLNLTAVRIKQDMTIKKANYTSLSGSLVCKGEPVGLVQFQPVDGPTGVRVKVLRSSGAKLLKHAYLAPGKKSSGLHVWWRNRSGMPAAKKFPVGKKSNVNWYKIGDKYRGIGGFFAAHPLKRLTGPRIEDIFAQNEIMDPVTIQANTVYLKNVDTAITEVIRRFG